MSERKELAEPGVADINAWRARKSPEAQTIGYGGVAVKKARENG